MAIIHQRYQCGRYSNCSFRIYIFPDSIIQLKHAKNSYLNYGLHIIRLFLSITWCIYPLIYKKPVLLILTVSQNH
ncbi:hypothetical protein HZS_1341 [Henneguya salminicola]|nr:hypothetical protein HZS_1341 [Henneguya salminicola]